MYVQVNRYSFSKKYLSAWRRITRLANQVYKEHGDVRTERMIIKRGTRVQVMELAYYLSRREFIRINKVADADERIIKLHSLLNRFVKERHIIEEFYDAI